MAEERTYRIELTTEERPSEVEGRFAVIMGVTATADGFFWKSFKEWKEEVGLTRRQVESARTKLKNLGMLETKLHRAMGSPTTHYKVKVEKVTEWIENHFRFVQTVQNDLPEPYKTITEGTADTLKEDVSKTSPYLEIFKKVTGRLPRLAQRNYVSEVIERHNFTVEDLKPFWDEWAIKRGYSPMYLAWLDEWAVSGNIPHNGKSQVSQDPKQAIEAWQERGGSYDES